MNRLKTNYLSILPVLLFVSSCATETVITPDLAKVTESADWTLDNRKPVFVKDSQQGSVSFDARSDIGIALLKNVALADGIIEVDIKGSDTKQKSFVGIAFRGQDEKTYEIVFFRPFNFQATDEEHRNHAVQYAAESDYPWHKLREQSPGKYEKALSPVVNPNEFFHVKIVLDKQLIQVFVNNASEPTLSVESLRTAKKGKLGFWMGDKSDGAFKNLKIIPAQQK